MEDDKLQVVVVGAGIAGLTCAITLSHYPRVHVTVLERVPTILPAGYGIQVPCNACHVLRSLGLLDRLIATSQGVAPGSLSLDYKSGQVLLNKDFSRFQDIYGAPWLFVHRADYIRVLLDEASRLGVQIRLGCEVEEVDTQAPWLRLANDEIVTADVIIGCDGVGSQIRAAIYPDIRPRYTVAMAYRALLTRDQLSADLFMPVVASSKCHFWLGPQAHIVMYPVHGGDTFNLVIIIEDFTLSRLYKHGDVLALVREYLMDWNPVVTELLQMVQQLVIFHLWNVEDLPSFTSERVTLMGDAAHPTLPYLGQGAAMAVEDALILGTLLGKLTQHAPSQSIENLKARAPTILQAYDTLQRDRTTNIVAKSQTQGHFNHLYPGEEQRERDADFAAFDAETTESKCPWVNSAFNREILGRDSEAVAVAEFKRLMADGLFESCSGE
ncbi:hypothetical protein EDB81DRAFT_939572 [Dactylonectria macrodidyma]|uniref:FAD-binding domain-containing protein n=1 Tax=Dactylonectria macrodidyma TaxID=307937 RepID=A0A9P9FSF8_9HYPO|nr:hypothetical protein EDB81DRAFT_939572 [Dactylonectria macrodidyma]